jgi:hypothetical protein
MCEHARSNRRKEDEERRILTPINEPIVVLLEGLGAISFPLEMNGRNAFGATSGVVVKCHLAQSADGSMEEFL